MSRLRLSHEDITALRSKMEVERLKAENEIMVFRQNIARNHVSSETARRSMIDP